MSIYVEKRKGIATGMLVVEVETNGKRLRERVASRREAKATEARMRSGIWQPSEAKALAAKGNAYAIKDLLKEAPAVWAGTKDARQSYRRLEVALGHLEPTKAITSITTSDLDAMVSKLKLTKGRGLKRNSKPGEPEERLPVKGVTLNRYLAAVSAALDWLEPRSREKLGITWVSPSIPWQPDDSLEKLETFSDSQQQALVSYFEGRGDSQMPVIIEALVSTGARIGELLALKPTDIEDGWVHIRQTVAHDSPKSGYQRTVPVSGDLGTRLSALAASGFPGYRACADRLKNAEVALGIPTSLTLHSFRHTTATRLNNAGVPTAVVKDYLGHRSIKTTLKYITVGAQNLRDAHAALVKPKTTDEREMNS